MRRFTSVIVCMVLLCVNVFSASMGVNAQKSSSAEIENAGFMLISENSNYKLYVNIDTSVIKVEDLQSGCVWSTNPDEKDMSELSETTRIQLNSQLKVSFLDESRNYVTVTSYDNCSSLGNYSIETVKKDGNVIGVKTVYDFKEESQSFKIPVKATIDEDGFSAEILFNEIEEYGTSKLCQIELFPFFSAGLGDDKGYLFVPDGSGAIIDFAHRYRNEQDYKKPVYGEDSAVNINLKAIDTSAGIKMPVFGMKKGNSAFFAEIQKGDALSYICASSSNERYFASSVWSAFSYRECDETGIVDGDNLIRTVRMADENPSSVNPVVKYRFLSGEDANYTGMAELYRGIVAEKYNLKALSESELEITPFLEVFGKTYKKSSFFGIPYNKAVVATTFKDTENIYNTLKDSGVDNFSMALYGFLKGGFNKKYVNEEKFDSKLGGNGGFKELVNTAKNADIYAVYDLNRDYSSANSFFKGSSFIQSLNSLTVVREQGALSTGTSAKKPKWLLLSGRKMLENSEELLESLDNPQKHGILYQNMGSEVYNDFRKTSPADRQQLLDTYSKILRNTGKTVKKVGSDGANIYMLAGADILTEVPLTSSNYKLFSYDIPFYTLVLGGYVKMTSMPINDVADENDAILKCAQYGICPTYRITECSSDELKDTNLRFLYNSKFSDWQEKIVEHYNFINNYQEETEWKD